MTEAADAIDPLDRVVVELIGIEEGSLTFRQMLKRVEHIATDVVGGASDYPQLKKLAIGLALSTGGAALQAGMAKLAQDPVQKVELSETDRRLLTGLNDQVAASRKVQIASRRFLQSVEKDPAVTDVVVSESPGGSVLVEIPRSEFAERGGLWDAEEEAPAERTTRDVWDVVLLRAPFVPKPRRWSFLRDGIPVSARMEDKSFLRAIRDGRVPIALQEGVLMRIEVEFIERQEGRVWFADDGSRRVVQVLAPLPLANPLPLASDPKKR